MSQSKENRLRKYGAILVSVVGSFLGVYLIVSAATTISSNISTGGTLTVTGAVAASSTLQVTGATTLYSTLDITGLTTLTYASTTAVTFTGTASTTNLVVGGNGTSLAGVVAGFCNIPNTTVNASSTAFADCTGATGIRSGDRVFVTATSSLAQNFIVQAASTTADSTVNIRIFNTGHVGGTTTGNISLNFWAFR